MKKNKLRLVKIIDWKKEPRFDENNLEKCYELPGYKYVYLNTDGKVFDFRPNEGKPSYNNLINWPEAKLYDYLVLLSSIAFSNISMSRFALMAMSYFSINSAYLKPISQRSCG